MKEDTEFSKEEASSSGVMNVENSVSWTRGEEGFEESWSGVSELRGGRRRRITLMFSDINEDAAVLGRDELPEGVEGLLIASATGGRGGCERY